MTNECDITVSYSSMETHRYKQVHINMQVLHAHPSCAMTYRCKSEAKYTFHTATIL
jgi:hypothetical protein